MPEQRQEYMENSLKECRTLLSQVSLHQTLISIVRYQLNGVICQALHVGRIEREMLTRNINPN